MIKMKEMEGKTGNELYNTALEKTCKHDISSALDDLLKGLELAPEDLEIINLVAYCYYVLADFETAEACWQRVLQIEPQNKTAIFRLNDFQSPSFQFWLKRYNAAIKEVENKNYDSARDGLRQLLEEHEGFVGVYQILGLCYLAASDKSNARKAWQKGLEFDLSNSSLLTYLNEEEKKNNPVLTHSEGKKKWPMPSLLLNRNNLAWLLAGILCMTVLLQSGLYLNSKRISKNTIADMKIQIEELNTRAGEENLADSGNMNDGFMADNEIVIEDEETAMAGSYYDMGQEKHYYNEGYSAYLEGNWKKAASNLEMVVAMQSKNYLNREALYYLARVYYLNSDYENAQKYYLRYVNEFPESNYTDDSLFYLGCIYHFTACRDKAIEYFKKLQELEPQSGYVMTKIFQELMEEAE